MATRVKNMSGTELEVPLPAGGSAIVPPNHSHEFDDDHARSLLKQSDVWTKYAADAPKKPSKQDEDGA